MTVSPKFDLKRKIQQDLDDLGIFILHNDEEIEICTEDLVSGSIQCILSMDVAQARSLGVTLLDVIFKARGLR